MNYRITCDIDNIDHIDWDLDLDGNYDSRSVEPMISAQYSTIIYGFVKAKVSYQSGLESTVSAKVMISDMSETSPTIIINEVLTEGDSATVKYSLGPNSYGSLVSINDVPAGISYGETLNLSDLSDNSTLTLTPFSNNGTLGNPTQVEIAIYGRGRAAQRDNSVAQESSSQNSLTEKINQLLSNLIIRAPNTGRR